MSVLKRPNTAPAAKHSARRKFDAATVSAFIAGDVGAFRSLYEMYADTLFAYCIYILGDAAAAEDAFQEVLIRIYTSRGQLREAGALKTWLLTVTRSVCLNLIRTSKFTPEFVYLDEDFDSESASSKELSIESIDPEFPEQIFQYAFTRIAPIYREAFMLKEIEGFSYSEIAKLTGATTANVKVRINRAKKMLRKLLAPHFRTRIKLSTAVRQQDSEVNE
ncbi:MAG TPA: RNA polymerase sigma factor [Candidatus Kapabacteria bacterium]|nr:RNA polymerase sigma factor [Candidatus Kapabacteria bacterium]